jgi:DNA-directed RNA polymerase beta' subunit
MKLDTIIIKLRMKYPDLFLVYTPENADVIIIRAYLTQSMIKIPTAGFSESIIIDIAKKIAKTVIRGIKGITYTEVMSIPKSEVQPDGSIKSDKVFVISTIGTNLEEVLDHPCVDMYRTQTNSIAEFEEMFGIEAARHKIILEIRSNMPSDDIIRTHTSIFADEMVYSGRVTSIQKTGLQARDINNVALRLSFQSPVQVIENAALNNLVNPIEGVSAPLICGQTPRIGTVFNNVSINEEFVQQQYRSLNKAIDDL